jgi:hypothetical protein
MSLINAYETFLSSNQHNEWQANIIILSADKAVVDLRFVADPGKWASKGNIIPNGPSTIYVGMERYSWFVDLLRNEKPLNVWVYPALGTLPPRMMLSTGAEPVGESEGT